MCTPIVQATYPNIHVLYFEGFWFVGDLTSLIDRFPNDYCYVLNMIATKHGTTTFAHYLLAIKRLLKILGCSRLDILMPWWIEANWLED